MEDTDPYDPASPDHMDVIRNPIAWASISTAMHTPNMTGEGSPKFVDVNISRDK